MNGQSEWTTDPRHPWGIYFTNHNQYQGRLMNILLGIVTIILFSRLSSDYCKLDSSNQEQEIVVLVFSIISWVVLFEFRNRLKIYFAKKNLDQNFKKRMSNISAILFTPSFFLFFILTLIFFNLDQIHSPSFWNLSDGLFFVLLFGYSIVIGKIVVVLNPDNYIKIGKELIWALEKTEGGGRYTRILLKKMYNRDKKYLESPTFDSKTVPYYTGKYVNYEKKQSSPSNPLIPNLIENLRNENYKTSSEQIIEMARTYHKLINENSSLAEQHTTRQRIRSMLIGDDKISVLWVLGVISLLFSGIISSILGIFS